MARSANGPRIQSGRELAIQAVKEFMHHVREFAKGKGTVPESAIKPGGSELIVPGWFSVSVPALIHRARARTLRHFAAIQVGSALKIPYSRLMPDFDEEFQEKANAQNEATLEAMEIAGVQDAVSENVEIQGDLEDNIDDTEDVVDVSDLAEGPLVDGDGDEVSPASAGDDNEAGDDFGGLDEEPLPESTEPPSSEPLPHNKETPLEEEEEGDDDPFAI